MPRAALLSLLLLLTVSCEFVAGVAVGAGAMYALSEDSAEQYLEAAMAETHAAALLELRARGEVTEDDPGAKEGIIQATVDGSQITIALQAITPSTTRVVVTARKWGTLAPDLAGAQRLADRIAHRLSE